MKKKKLEMEALFSYARLTLSKSRDVLRRNIFHGTSDYVKLFSFLHGIICKAKSHSSYECTPSKCMPYYYTYIHTAYTSGTEKSRNLRYHRDTIFLLI